MSRTQTIEPGSPMGCLKKKLGRIADVKVGFCGYQDSMIGIAFRFEGKDWSVADSWCGQADGLGARDPEFLAGVFLRIATLLREAKVKDVAELHNIPVEVTFDGTIIRCWRVLDEVL